MKALVQETPQLLDTPKDSTFCDKAFLIRNIATGREELYLKDTTGRTFRLNPQATGWEELAVDNEDPT